jgi:hypothetical protein
MLVTLPGMVTEVRLVQTANAASPMLVTLLGMVMEIRLEQPEKADSPIPVTVYLTPPVVTVTGIFTVLVLALSVT